MYCSHCGTELPEGSTVCKKCGTAIKGTAKRGQAVDFEALVDTYLTGGETAKNEAFTALYEASYKAVFAHVQKYTRDQTKTDDVVQNAYVIALSKMDQIKDKANFTAWMKTIAYNEYLQTLRKYGKESVFNVVSDTDGNETSEADFIADDTIAMPEDALASSELHTLLLESMNELTEAQRIVLKGFYFDGKAIQTLASELGIPVNTVKTNLSRGRKNLADKASSYANAYGLKLVPVAIIPLMAVLSKKDVLACEAEAVSQASFFAAIQKESAGVHMDKASQKAKEYAKKAKDTYEKARNSKEVKEAGAQLKDVLSCVKAGNIKEAVGYPIAKAILGAAAGLVIIGGVSSTVHKGSDSSYVSGEEISADRDRSGRGILDYDALFDGISLEFSGVEGSVDAIMVDEEQGPQTGNLQREIDRRSVYYQFGAGCRTAKNGDTVVLEANYYDSYEKKHRTETKDFVVSGLYYMPQTLEEIPDELLQTVNNKMQEYLDEIFDSPSKEEFYANPDAYVNDQKSTIIYENVKTEYIGAAYGTYVSLGDKIIPDEYKEIYGDRTNALYVVYKVTYDETSTWGPGSNPWANMSVSGVSGYIGAYVKDIYIDENGNYSVGKWFGINEDSDFELSFPDGMYMDIVMYDLNGDGWLRSGVGTDSAEAVRNWQLAKYGESIFKDLDIQDIDNCKYSTMHKEENN